MRRESGIKDNIKLPNAVKKYDEGWGNMMIDIWRNRINMYHAVRTGQLRSSVGGGLQHIQNINAEFRFHFVNYGMHVENGVGNGYAKGNNGDLIFLDEGIKDGTGINKRELYGYNKGRRAGSAKNAYSTMGMARERRPWFTPSWWYSRKVIGRQMVDLIGESYVGMFDNLDK